MENGIHIHFSDKMEISEMFFLTMAAWSYYLELDKMMQIPQLQAVHRSMMI